MLSYLFWPNPPAPTYGDPKVVAVLLSCAILVGGSFVVRRWRAMHTNAVTRKLSRSWPQALLWFGLSGAFLTVCRVEGISYLSMRFLWAVWLLAIVVFAFAQWKLWHVRHYEIVPQDTPAADPRDKYLPKKKRK